MYTIEQVEKTVKAKGYKWFEDSKNKGYDVNIVGIRNSKTENQVTNHFDDFLTISYKVEGEWKFNCWNATTDPGQYWMEHPMSSGGCAILVPGQYRSAYKVGSHFNYEALRQQRNVKCYRDNNLDDIYDTDVDSITEGLYGINIHRSNPYTESYYVDKWSAGCQVFKKVNDFDTFMIICNKAKNIWGNSFTYTLLESQDIFENA